jgi:Cu/Ag efflux protein CusF
MSKKMLIPIVAAILAALPLAARAESPEKTMDAAAKATMTATVVKVDSANRVLTLKGPNGNVVDVEVSSAVKRFPEIKVGDQLNVTYAEALVVGVSKADSSKPLGMSVEQSLAPAKGEKPAGVATRRISATVAVDSIDLKAREVTVHTSDGTTETFHIRDPKNAKGVKPGDKITLVYEEAVAVSVTAPAPKASTAPRS